MYKFCATLSNSICQFAAKHLCLQPDLEKREEFGR